MNETVKRIVEILFQDTEMTEEVQAMQDELMDNCQQRYEDLVAQGRSEDEAIALVVESLKGMEEVIGAYPRSRSAASHAQETDEDGRVLYFPAAQVKRVDVNLLSQDIALVPGQGDQVVVHLKGKEGIHLNARLAGETLYITRQEENAGKGSRWWGWVWFSSWGEEVEVELPASCCPRLTVHTTSGDLRMRDIAVQDVRLDTMSGDITLQVDPARRMREVMLKSTSGDINVTCSAERMEFQSMSGDVTFRGDCPELTAQSISGDVDLQGCFEQARMKSTSGDICLEEQGHALRQVDAKTTSGDVDIRLPKDTPSVHFTGKSSVGDIRNHFPDLGMENSVCINAQTTSGDVKIR